MVDCKNSRHVLAKVPPSNLKLYERTDVVLDSYYISSKLGPGQN
jgi:hypothetical protein